VQSTTGTEALVMRMRKPDQINRRVDVRGVAVEKYHSIMPWTNSLTQIECAESQLANDRAHGAWWLWKRSR